MASVIPLANARRYHPRLLLDTTVLIDSYQRHIGKQRRDLLPLLRDFELTCSIVSMYEFLHRKDGSLLGAEDFRERQDWIDGHRIRILRLDTNCSISLEAMMGHACPPGLQDTLIAATCIANRLPLVTSNTKHFDVIQHLSMIEVN